jgi:hypothetical protein
MGFKVQVCLLLYHINQNCFIEKYLVIVEDYWPLLAVTIKSVFGFFAIISAILCDCVKSTANNMATIRQSLMTLKKYNVKCM